MLVLREVTWIGSVTIWVAGGYASVSRAGFVMLLSSDETFEA